MYLEIEVNGPLSRVKPTEKLPIKTWKSNVPNGSLCYNDHFIKE